MLLNGLLVRLVEEEGTSSHSTEDSAVWVAALAVVRELALHHAQLFTASMHSMTLLLLRCSCAATKEVNHHDHTFDRERVPWGPFPAVYTCCTHAHAVVLSCHNEGDGRDRSHRLCYACAYLWLQLCTDCR